MSFYRNTRSEIIKIVPAIAAENNSHVRRLDVAIPIDSICSFNRKNFEYCYPDEGATTYLKCVKSGGDCIGCYFCYRPSSFCPVCSSVDRRDGSDVIFKEI